MRTRLVVLLLAIAVAFSVWAPARAAGAGLTVSDQAIQSSYVALNAVTADAAGSVVVTTSDGTTVLGKTPIKAGNNGRVLVKIDVTKATPELKVGLLDDASQRVLDIQSFKVIGLSPVDLLKKPGEASQIVVGRVIAQQDGWVAIRRERFETDMPVIFGSAPVKAGVNDNVAISISDPNSMTGWEIAAALFVDAGEKGKFEFPGADLPAVLGNSIVDEPVGLGQTFIRVADALVGTDGQLLIPAVGAPSDGFIVVLTAGKNSQVIGSAPVKQGVNNDVAIGVKTATPVGNKGAFLKFFAQMPSSIAEPPDFDPDTVKVLLSDGLTTWDQSADVIKATGGIIVSRVVTSKPGWLEVISSADQLPTIAVAPIAAGISRNVFIPVKPEDISVGLTILIQIHIDAGTIGTFEFPGPDAKVKDSADQFVRSGFETH
jgi:hypothetical protein